MRNITVELRRDTDGRTDPEQVNIRLICPLQATVFIAGETVTIGDRAALIELATSSFRRLLAEVLRS